MYASFKLATRRLRRRVGGGAVRALLAAAVAAGALVSLASPAAAPPAPTDAEVCAWAASSLPLPVPVPVICVPAEPDGVAGRSYANHVELYLGSWAGADGAYLREVLAHELGHVWEHHVLLPLGLGPRVQQVLGWPSPEEWTPAENEAWADVYAYALGYWTDYGTGWRHPIQTGMPTAEQIQILRNEGLLPADA